MKKKLLLLSLSSVLLLTACGGGNDNKESSTSNGDKTEQTKKEDKKNKIASIEEKIENGSFEMSFTSENVGATYSGDGFTSYQADGTFVLITVQVKNIEKEAQSFDSSAFSLEFDGSTYSPTTLLTESSMFESLNPGIEKETKVFFDVPEEVANSEKTVVKYEKTLSSDGKPFKFYLNK